MMPNIDSLDTGHFTDHDVGLRRTGNHHRLPQRLRRPACMRCVRPAPTRQRSSFSYSPPIVDVETSSFDAAPLSGGAFVGEHKGRIHANAHGIELTGYFSGP
jgi:hypothetical protein